MEERSIKELLQLMLENKGLFVGGLCYFTRKLQMIGFITDLEYIKLNKWLELNLPERTYRFSQDMFFIPQYCFPHDEWQPRKEWLEQQIEKL